MGEVNTQNLLPDKIPTKQRILECAADLFAKTGYTETSIRDLAAAAGLNAASIYNHFPSKNAILEYMLEDYIAHSSGASQDIDMASILRGNPTTDGILACMKLTFPEGREQYFLTVLFVLMQEQHRNDLVRSFMADHFIFPAERKVGAVVEILKEQRILRADTDPDYWMKLCSSLIYAFASRSLLNIGDNSPGFIGLGMSGLLRRTFDMMLETSRRKA